ncbi:MAG: hypothetical protein ACFFC7_11965 [Candidatus Hermodarchaeota archaeon]
MRFDKIELRMNAHAQKYFLLRKEGTDELMELYKVWHDGKVTTEEMLEKVR